MSSHQLTAARLLTLVVYALALVSPATATKLSLEASIDHGDTWQVLTSPLVSPPSSALIRLSNSTHPVITVPSCALTSTLQVYAWHRADDPTPFALRWYSPVCHAGARKAQYARVNVVRRTTTRTAPDWASHAKRHVAHNAKSSKEEKKKGFFSKYGIWIMLFIALALAHGIRIGLRELRDEMEREENAALRPTASERSSAGSVRVTVPRRKNAATRSGTRRRSTATAAGTSSK